MLLRRNFPQFLTLCNGFASHIYNLRRKFCLCHQFLSLLPCVGPWLWKYAKIKKEMGECELHGRYGDCYWVKVSKRAEKMERSKSLDEEIRDDI
jgi:hypothetical protein